MEKIEVGHMVSLNCSNGEWEVVEALSNGRFIVRTTVGENTCIFASREEITGIVRRDTIVRRAAIRARLQALREELGEIAAECDYIDHDAGRGMHTAREALHFAWSVLRAEPLEA